MVEYMFAPTIGSFVIESISMICPFVDVVRNNMDINSIILFILIDTFGSNFIIKTGSFEIKRRLLLE